MPAAELILKRFKGFDRRFGLWLDEFGEQFSAVAHPFAGDSQSVDLRALRVFLRGGECIVPVVKGGFGLLLELFSMFSAPSTLSDQSHDAANKLDDIGLLQCIPSARELGRASLHCRIPDLRPSVSGDFAACSVQPFLDQI